MSAIFVIVLAREDGQAEREVSANRHLVSSLTRSPRLIDFTVNADRILGREPRTRAIRARVIAGIILSPNDRGVSYGGCDAR
jgi:hypothetical protein